LRVYAKDQAARSGIALELDVKPIDIDLPPPVETACFRIAQEAVTNVLQHAQSTTLMVQLVHHEHQLRLVVEDTGRGFDVEALITRSNTASQLGVLGMRERAQLAGGEVRIESAEGRGTRVVATFSLAATGGAE
jgi:signal transduction histidine kinase